MDLGDTVMSYTSFTYCINNKVDITSNVSLKMVTFLLIIEPILNEYNFFCDRQNKETSNRHNFFQLLLELMCLIIYIAVVLPLGAELEPREGASRGLGHSDGAVGRPAQRQ